MKTIGVDGLEVCLRVNGHDIQEFEDDTGGALVASKASAYVEATSGAEFTVQYHSDPETFRAAAIGDCVVCRVYLDGKYVTGRVLDSHVKKMVVIDGVHESRDEKLSLRPFQFADLATNDGPVKGFDKKAISGLGEVRVACQWGRRTSPFRPLSSKDLSTFVSESSVPEKCLKGRAISNRATLGGARSSRGMTSVDVDYPYGEEPFASFIFKYRSRRDLQIEGIIPRTPSPPPLEERDEDDLSPEEARELIRRMKARENAIKTEAKKEKRTHSQVIDDDEDDDDDDVTIASGNHRSKRNRTFRDSGVEIVDLSED